MAVLGQFEEGFFNSNLDPIMQSGNPWMGGNTTSRMPNLFGTGSSGGSRNYVGSGSGSNVGQSRSSGVSYGAPPPVGGVSFTPNYDGGQGTPTYGNYASPQNVPDSISLQAVGYDGVLWNSARSQADYNAKLNSNMIRAYEERKARGEQVEDVTPYLWDTDFNTILARGQRGELGHGLAPQFANGPSYYSIGVPAGAYHAIDPSTVPASWDGLGGAGTTPFSPTQSANAPLPSAAGGQPNNGQPGGGANNLGALLASLTGGGQGMTSPITGDVNQFLANLAQNMGFLQQMAATGQTAGAANAGPNQDVAFMRNLVQNPTPYDASDYWQKLVTAQDRSTKQNAGNLQEFFNSTGNRFSTGFGDAMTDYWTQTNRDQNALLAQLQMQGYETERNRQFGGATSLSQLTSGLEDNAQNRALQAANSLGSYAFQGPALQSQQNFNWALNDRNQQFQQYLNNSNQGFQAAMYNAGAADQSSMALLNNASQAANQLNQNAIFGANNLFGAENSALNNLFGSATGSIPWWMQSEQFAQQLGLNTATGLNASILQNLGLGSQIGGQQYQTYQDQINRAYQEFLRTSPYYHPNLQMLQQLSLAQSGQYFPQYQPSTFNQVGGLLGMLLPYLSQIG